MKDRQIILEGFVGQDPQFNDFLRTQKTLVTVAIHHSCRTRDGSLERNTTWYNVVAWDEMAHYAYRHFVKGSRIRVEGTLRRYYYTDQKGLSRSYSQIIARRLSCPGSMKPGLQ